MKYYIYQGVGDAALTKIGEVENTKTFTVTGLTPNTSYRFAVSAFNGIRESEKTDAVTITTGDIPVTSITLTIDKSTLEVGQTGQCTIVVVPENNTDGKAVLTSSKPAIATVDANGKITAVAAGSTDITAKAGTVTSKVVTITVYEALVTVSDLASSDVTANGVTLTWK